MTKLVLNRFKIIKNHEIDWVRASGDRLLADAMIRYNNEALSLAQNIMDSYSLIKQKKKFRLYQKNDFFCEIRFDRKGNIKSIFEYQQLLI